MDIIIITTITIQDLKKTLKSNSDPLIIAEIAQAHEGSLGLAHSYIDLAAKSGADAVKFQTHIASAESTHREPWRVKFSNQYENRYDYWRHMEFDKEQWKELKDHSKEKGLLFICSPFSFEAAELLLHIGIDKWKIASGEINNIRLFDTVIDSRLPVLISTGMSKLDEIDKYVTYLKEGIEDITILQCTSLYPTPVEKVGLNMIQFFKDRYNCKSGISDHSGNIFTGLAATALGADAIEVHITFSKEMFGPDVPVSLTGKELSMLVQGTKYIRKLIDNPIDKNQVSGELEGMRDLFMKSIVANQNIKKGSIISEDLVSFKKPGTGLPPSKLPEILGKKLIRNLESDELILFTDIE